MSNAIETCLADERREQTRWRLRPEFANYRRFDQLLENEFISADEQHARQDRLLGDMISFSVGQVPFYQDLFARLGLSATDVCKASELHRLPVLVRNQVVEQAAAFRPGALPSDERIRGEFSSSGTTGKPVRVLMTERSNEMFTLAVQRQYRWFRFDPAERFASITSPAEKLPLRKDGTPHPPGTSYRYPRWRFAGLFFYTGEQAVYAMDNPVDAQYAWVQQQRPGYLTSNAQGLEHIAYACEGHWPVDSLKAVLSIATQMTPAMRAMVTQTMKVPIQENYGFNEIGMVAVRCPAGRFHVMNEHCLVEIVDDEGKPVAPGNVGRLLVSSLTNMAMPLIRYDAGDLAKAAIGPCPCGRTLPSFTEIIGRYRRTAFLPEGTLQWRELLSEALAAMPAGLSSPVRQYQLHQYRDRGFEFRVVAARPLDAAFKQRIMTAWNNREGASEVPLVIVQVEQIARGPGGKFQDFNSDYIPAPDGMPGT